MLPYIAEFIGTMTLVILGGGIVTDVTLDRSGMKIAGSIQTAIALGIAELPY